jgi:hypothetical protein
MIQRLFGSLWTLFVYTCVGTVISQVILLVYLHSAWKIDKQRWMQMIATAQGIMPAEGKETHTKNEEDKVAEQASYEQVLDARAMKYRDMELRERDMRNSLSLLQSEQLKLAEDKKRYKQLRDTFDTQLSEMSEGTVAAGRDEVRRTLENVKPKQAKALILEMLNKQEIDNVVTLLSPMQDNKRAKIFGEFKTPDELVKLSEVLRRIREGLPKVTVPETTRKQLEQMKSPQL